MRTTFPVVLVLAMAVAAAFFGGSGFNALVQGDQNTGALEDEVVSAANDSAVKENEGLSAGRAGGGSDDIVGLIVSGGQSIFGFAGMIALLPLSLQNLGFPPWFALPIGSVFYILVTVGVIQFVTGRIWS